MAVMKASEFVAKLKAVAQNYKTLYVMGCFGAPLTGGNVSRYCNNHEYNKQAARTQMIKAAANQNPPVFGFDCVCLIKGILWGWNGDASKTYGGASYAVNGVPDIGADTMITKCKGISTNFSNVEVGEALWCSGHIGVYIGGGLASFVYSRDHVVSELNGDRAVITYGGVTVAAVRVSDLTLVKE